MSGDIKKNVSRVHGIVGVFFKPRDLKALAGAAKDAGA